MRKQLAAAALVRCVKRHKITPPQQAQASSPSTAWFGPSQTQQRREAIPRGAAPTPPNPKLWEEEARQASPQICFSFRCLSSCRSFQGQGFQARFMAVGVLLFALVGHQADPTLMVIPVGEVKATQVAPGAPSSTRSGRCRGVNPACSILPGGHEAAGASC